MKDKMDLGTMSVPKLFRKLLIPTLLGMVFSAVFIITDGIFVGQGIGSDAIAAVNITAPLFLINTGVALMFGIGASVVASINLSKGKLNIARVHITQAVIVSSVLLMLYSLFLFVNVETIVVLLGSSERLLPLTVEYVHWFSPFLAFSALLSSGLFFVRLDGSPNYAMICNVLAAVFNILGDWLFIYVLKLGMFGAALATSMGYIIGAVMILVYMLRKKHSLHLVPVTVSLKSIRQAMRSVGYMCRLGFSTFLCQASVASMMFAGNAAFMRYLGEDGVASYSVACFFFPIVLMVYNAIAQSAQPILSYNYGQGNKARVNEALRLSLATAISCGLTAFVITFFFSSEIASLFVHPGTPAYTYASEGLPLFASGFVCFGINMVAIGYYQSLERHRPANYVTVLRGFILMLLCFWLMPIFMGFKGMWLAVPMTELVSFIFIVTIYCRSRILTMEK